MATEMARGEVGLKGKSQFVVLSEVLDLRLAILLHFDGPDDVVTEGLDDQTAADSGRITMFEVQNRMNAPAHSIQ